MNNNTNTNLSAIPENWIAIVDEMFTCAECEHSVKPQTNTVDGIVDADLDQIKDDLKQYPTKVIYAICPVCGMEYVFKLVDNKLYLQPSEEEK